MQIRFYQRAVKVLTSKQHRGFVHPPLAFVCTVVSVGLDLWMLNKVPVGGYSAFKTCPHQVARNLFLAAVTQ